MNLPGELLTRLNKVQQGLVAASENAENDFLKIGQELQSGYTSVSELANLALKTTQHIGAGSEENELDIATKAINKALENLKGRSGLVESKLPPVGKVVDHLDDLNSKRDEIEMIAKYLRAVALNIFIETARSEVSNKNFSIIAEEIKELSESIIGMAKSIRNDSENAKTRFMEMYANISTGMRTMSTVTIDAESSVLGSVQNFKKLMDISLSSVKQAETMSREISKQIGTIVVGVQFHDDMRQRIEHIVSALKKVGPLCESISENDEKQDTESLGTAHSVLIVQKAQVQSIVAELEEIYQKNRESFDNIISEIEQLVQILSEGGNQSLGNNDIFEALSLALSEFQELDNQGGDLVNQLEETYKQASDTTDALSAQAKQIHAISRDSHTKALNAIIATQNMGLEGRTLLTLAGEMKTLSYQAENFVTDVSSIIESIIQVVKNIAISDTSSEGADGDDERQPDLNMIISNISSLCSRLQNDSDLIYKQSEALNTNLRKAKNGLDFFPVVGAELNNQLESIDEALEILSPWAAAIDDNSLRDNLANEIYTMEKERQIHEQALDIFEPSDSAGAADTDQSDAEIFVETPVETVDTDDEEQEFDDNIELF